MWELDRKEDWAPKNLCFWTVVLEKTLENPLNSKEIKLVHPKGNQSWIFVGRTDTEPEAPILWPPDVRRRLIGKYPIAGKDWRQEDKGPTEDEMVGWYYLLNGYEFKQMLRDREGQRRLACCSLWGHKELTWLVNWTVTVDHSLPDFSVNGILQARILEWVAMASYRVSSQPRDWTHVSYISCIGRWVLYH